MKRTLIALALAAILPISAQASDKLSYSYVEANYSNLDGDFDGWGLRGSVAFNESFYGTAAYTSYQVLGTDVGYTDIGVGYRHGMSDKTDFIAEVAYVNADAGGANVDGYRVSAGFRGQLSDRVEGLVKANYIDSDLTNGDFSGTVGAQVKLNDTWGITGEVEFADNDNAYLLGLRASF